MKISEGNLLDSILEGLDCFSYIRYEEIPNIDLYMDQVTTFMNEKLQATTRHPGEDKILTKTMINNYAKDDLLPPPIKKKYSREHMMVLIMIYYLKGVISFHDIQEVLNPITEKYFQTEESFDLERIYSQLINIEETQKSAVKEDITQMVEKSRSMFQDAPKEDAEYFSLLALVMQLGFDVYVKRLLIEKLIDGYRTEHAPTPDTKNNKGKKKEPKTE